MSFSFCSLASGSSGNSYVIKTKEGAYLVDAGIPGKRILAGLDALGMSPEDIKGIFITHEHGDHIKSIKMMARLCTEAKVYGTYATLDAIADLVNVDAMRPFNFDEKRISLGDVVAEPFPLSHDAVDPAGYAFVMGKRKIAIMTDTGYVTEEEFRGIRDADILVIEANHEINVLMMSQYPYTLKTRILGDYGHLSNEASGRALGRFLSERSKEEPPLIVLAHLSNENNSPDMAYVTIKNILEEEGYKEGKDYELTIAPRDSLSALVEI